MPALNMTREEFRAEIASAFNEAISDGSITLDVTAPEIDEGEIIPLIKKHAPASQVSPATIRKSLDAALDAAFVSARTPALAAGQIVRTPKVLDVDPRYKRGTVSDQINLAILSKEHMVLTGHSGTGKTYPIEQELRASGMPYYLFSCTADATVRDLVGRTGLKPAAGGGMETVFEYGILAMSLQSGVPFIADEIDKLPGEVASVFYRTLTDGALTVAETGETLVAPAGWVFFATCNTLGDESGLYNGHHLDAALINRLECIKVEYMPESQEIDILIGEGLDNKRATEVVKIFSTLRRMLAAGEITQAPSTRNALSMARRLLGVDKFGNPLGANFALSPLDAFNRAYGSKLPPSEYKEVMGVLRNQTSFNW
jgi:MoxR-like ATPase